jgi:hypothetical protein
MPRNWLSCPPNSIPFVSVHIGPDCYLAMIDPGSFFSMISPHLSMALGLPKEGYHRIVSVHGDIRTRPLVTLPPSGVGEIELAPCQAVISDLNPLRDRLDLLLGVSAFKNRRLQIDFKEGRVYIFPVR